MGKITQKQTGSNTHSTIRSKEPVDIDTIDGFRIEASSKPWGANALRLAKAAGKAKPAKAKPVSKAKTAKLWPFRTKVESKDNEDIVPGDIWELKKDDEASLKRKAGYRVLIDNEGVHSYQNTIQWVHFKTLGLVHVMRSQVRNFRWDYQKAKEQKVHVKFRTGWYYYRVVSCAMPIRSPLGILRDIETKKQWFKVVKRTVKTITIQNVEDNKIHQIKKGCEEERKPFGVFAETLPFTDAWEPLKASRGHFKKIPDETDETMLSHISHEDTWGPTSPDNNKRVKSDELPYRDGTSVGKMRAYANFSKMCM